MTDIKALREELHRYQGISFDKTNALLDELEGLRALAELNDEDWDEEPAAAWEKNAWAERRRAEAAEAKLAKVRELDWNAIGNAVMYVALYHTAQQSREHAIKLSLDLREFLAILDAEPPTATVQPTEEQGEANV